MLNHRVRVIAGLMLAVAALAASGCGSSSSKSSTAKSSTATATSQSSSTATAGATPSGTPIAFGFLCECTGPVAASLAGYAPGVSAWVKWTNAHGGIDGHPIKLMMADTQSDPTKALAGVNQLVASNVAAMASGTGLNAVFAPVVQAHKLPVLGPINAAGVDQISPMIFPTGTSPAYQAYAIAYGGHVVGGTKSGLAYCAESPNCAQTVPLYKAGATKAGLPTVWQGSVAGSQPDYSAACLAAQSAGANAVIFSVPATTAVRFAQDCAKNNFKPHYTMNSAVFTGSMLSTPPLDGAVLQYGNIPYFETVPALNDFHAAMQQYESSFLKSPGYAEVTVQGWIAGEQLAAAVRAANVPASTPVTSADVLRGLYALDGSTLGGLTQPLTYKPGVGHVNTCFYLGQIKGGKLTSLNGAKPICP